MNKGNDTPVDRISAVDEVLVVKRLQTILQLLGSLIGERCLQIALVILRDDNDQAHGASQERYTSSAATWIFSMVSYASLPYLSLDDTHDGVHGIIGCLGEEEGPRVAQPVQECQWYLGLYLIPSKDVKLRK